VRQGKEGLKGLISKGKKETSFLQNDQTASEFRPASCQLVAGLSVRSCKVAGPILTSHHDLVPRLEMSGSSLLILLMYAFMT
jgi:hypothetical protein